MAATAQHYGVDRDEVSRFARMAADWWDPNGPMKPLHRINPQRLAFLKRALCIHFGRDERAIRALSGLQVLDIGCGAGLLSEPLARMGAEVTGVEPAEETIAVARSHADESNLSIRYVCGLADDLVSQAETFDVVLAMEVVEHVPDVPAFLRTVSSLVKPGGFFAGSTLNRTLRSYALAIVGAEYVMRWLPVGTHSWEKFVRPREFEEALAGAGLDPLAVEGLVYNPLADTWRLSRDTAVNYFITAAKRG
ncbi:MAG TPA: bifunctional 2-polyprenyl-6-hydroxyphenol methylase/3-demethylubiquinol 3-O-methyltransferase UbiG [Beijerinckiaceae bacterium]|nr:bifunctional 2-polyprenyl-6-hydroxyphenol methylase/3-demethylubiquinol 3-O-methyltransferase UbiG [Beijerinckiaceae bacterium]